MGALEHRFIRTVRSWGCSYACISVIFAAFVLQVVTAEADQLTAASQSAATAAESVTVRFFADSTRLLQASQVVSLPDHLWTDGHLNRTQSFGYSTSAIWCQIRINSPAKSTRVVELPTTRLDHVQWFLMQAGEPVLISQNGFKDSGDLTVAPRDYPTLCLPQNPAGGSEVLFRTTSACALAIPVNVTTTTELQSMVISRTARGHLEIGVSFAIVAVCVTLSLLFRDASLLLLGLCGTFVICYGISFDTVAALREVEVPAWLSRTGCSVFCTLQALAMLVFTLSQTGYRNLRRFDCVVLATGVFLSGSYIFLHAILPCEVLLPWLNAVCIIDSACSVWTISHRFRNDRQMRDLLPVLTLILAHVPSLLLILYFYGFSFSYLPPQSLRMIAMPIVFCGMAFSLLHRRRSSDSLKLQTALAQVGESDARLMALRYQLNPHMLMNSLTAISSLSRRSPEQIPELIRNLSAILHARLRPASGFCWSLHQELALARNLIAVEQVRFDGQLTFTESIAAETLNYPVPEMLLQPLIENAAKYCSRSSGAPELQLATCLSGNMLHIRISNSVSGTASVPPPVGLSIGHANVQERLDLTYGGIARFQFLIVDSIAVAEISIPAQSRQTG